MDITYPEVEEKKSEKTPSSQITESEEKAMESIFVKVEKETIEESMDDDSGEDMLDEYLTEDESQPHYQD